MWGPVAKCRPSPEPDVYVVECEHIRLDGAVHEQPFRGMAVLVCVGGLEADRLALWPIRHALSFARCSEIGGADWPERLAKRVAAVQPQFATAVVYVGTDAVVATETVQSVVDSIRRQLQPVLAGVVVVSADCARLAQLREVSGFVQGVTVTTGDTARHVFAALSVFLAPDQLNGIDWEDLAPVFGTAERPTLLADAMWMRHGDGRLIFLNPDDPVVIRNAGWIVATPLVQALRYDELRRIQQALRNLAGEKTTSITFAANNALMPGLVPAAIGLVPLLCR